MRTTALEIVGDEICSRWEGGVRGGELSLSVELVADDCGGGDRRRLSAAVEI